MIPELLRFLEIDDETKERGRELWELISPRADSVVEEFYAKLKTSEISPQVTDTAIEHLKIKQKQHWAALFKSRFGADYANSVHRIGIKHHDIELSMLWYVAGYMALKIAFTDLIAEAQLPPITKRRFMKILDKYVAFDMALSLSVYNAAIID